MTDERLTPVNTDRQVERDSQLSAMFDGELPAAECELLARRLTRDELLRAQWSRFAMIGAALRAERGVALHDRVDFKVQSAIAQEPTYGEGAAPDAGRTAAAVPAVARARHQRWARFGYPVAGASIAAGVAALSLFWLQGTPDAAQQLASATVPAGTEAPTRIVLTPEPVTVAATNSPDSGAGDASLYSTPAPNSATSIAPPARLANYVVAHSEYSGPVTRRMALLGIVGAEAGEGGPVSPEAASSVGVEETDAP
jgi:sigma-E factor negative regulatory protein RseA